jgi:TetR/AcrR family transcriptional regulator, transcriptional repressor for nem operon
MPAKIGFDYARAVDRATQLFWRGGYSRTPLRRLLKVMGIGEGSFYNTFGSKKRLFLECLRHYNDTVSRRRLDALLAPASVKEGIRAFFRTVLDELDNPKTPQVCLLAGSISSDVLSDRELSRYVLHDMQTFVGVFLQRLETAKNDGELGPHFPTTAAAQVLLTFLQGLFRTIRVLQDRAAMEQQIEILLRGLGL